MYSIKKPRVAPWIVGGSLFLLTASIAMFIFWFSDDWTSRRAQPATTRPSTTVRTAFMCVEGLSDEFKIGQKLMAAGYNELIAEQIKPFVEAKLGGVIIMDETPASSITALKAAFTIAPFVAVDQEGGTVQRYISQGLVPGAQTMAADFTPQQAYAIYKKDSEILKAIGLTTNLAPVAGVIGAGVNPLPGRMYSTDPKIVTAYASEAIEAYRASGLNPVIKHFPGIGTAAINTDFGTATTAPLAALEAADLPTFKDLAKFKADIMISNAIVPDLTGGQPAVWSPAAVQLLRSYGYENSVIYSDSLSAAAIPGSLEDASLKAWQAGVDIALVVQAKSDAAKLKEELSIIITKATAALESGQLDKDEVSSSVVRILARKGIDPCSISPAS